MVYSKSFSRRAFVIAGTTSLVSSMLPRPARAATLQSIGIQLYTLRDEMQKDFDGTLRKVATLGFKEVEFASFYGRTASQVSQALRAAGLSCASAHVGFNQLRDDLPKIVNYASALGLKYLICAESGVADRDRYARLAARMSESAAYEAYMSSLTLDDWHWNADVFNKIGERTKAAGIHFGYHNHTADFRRLGDVVAYEELLKRTDPALVVMELDCAWVTAAGADPVEYLTRYAARVRALHVKDITAIPAADKTATTQLTEVGRGVIQWPRIFFAARAAGIEHYFVEQDEHFRSSPLESTATSIEYLRAMSF